MPVVTVSGTMGSGAREVARLAADLLGIDYVDQEILVDAAQRLGVSARAVAQRDEHVRTFGERLASLLRTFLERSAAAGIGDPLMGASGLEVLLARSYGDLTKSAEHELDDALYMKTVTAIIRELSQRGNIVILGRGSHLLLREHPTALHVLTLAPLEVRVQRFAEREGLSSQEAAKRVHDLDKGRAAFHHKFFKAEADDPACYDLAIDTSRLSFEVAAQLVAEAARLGRETAQP
jgi:cytidylate kinase